MHGGQRDARGDDDVGGGDAGCCLGRRGAGVLGVGVGDGEVGAGAVDAVEADDGEWARERGHDFL